MACVALCVAFHQCYHYDMEANVDRAGGGVVDAGLPIKARADPGDFQLGK
jgi:hypothetical protein